MTNSTARAAILVGAIAVLASCSSSHSAAPPGSPASAGRSPSSTGAKPPRADGSYGVRIVNVMPAGSAPLDVLTGDPTTGRKVVSGLAPGKVSDYVSLPVGAGSNFVESAGKQLGLVLPPRTAGDRMTLAVGTDTGGGAITEWEEAHGAVVNATGQIGTNPTTAPAGQATIIASNLGGGSTVTGVALGQPGKGCLAEPGSSGDSREMAGPDVRFAAQPGTAQLAWFTDTACTAEQVSASAQSDLRAGEYAYAFSWLADATHVRIIVVPVAASGAGTAGVATSADGPTLSP
jgi:hypothetical protein